MDEIVFHPNGIIHSLFNDIDKMLLPDTKPYVHDFDHHKITRSGWLRNAEDSWAK